MSALPPGLEYRGGNLFFDGAPLEDAARRFGTPAYAYSPRRVRERWRELRRAFAASRPLVCFAMKANPSLTLGRLLAELGAGAEVVSGGELRLALQAGFPARRIIFSGVGKTASELRLGLRAGILAFNVESLGELAALEAEAARLGRRAPVLIRLNPDIDAGTHKHITTGLAANKFGLPLDEALEAFRRAGRSPRLRALGLHAHLGSQILSAGPYRRSARLLARLAESLESQGFSVPLLDLGGGMGLPYGAEAPLDLGAVASAAAPLARKGRRLLLEPGRFLSAESGVLLARVLYVKGSGRRRFVVLDAGMNDLLRPALYAARHPIAPLKLRPGRQAELEAVGPICESADSFGRLRAVPPEPGDLWAVLLAGAYGFSMASQYNGRPRPPELWLKGGKFLLARKRETFRDLSRGETALLI